MTGFGLKEAKDFFDVVRGPWVGYDTTCVNYVNKYGNGQPNSIVLESDKARKLFDELSKLDCVVAIANHDINRSI